jgi:GNAT superfamily N-acetyltransferase
MRVREGMPQDIDAVLAMGDEAVGWMIARGTAMQWGTEPWTGNEKREQAIYLGLLGQGARIAETDEGELVGVLLTSRQGPSTALDVGERELYINWLLTSRRHSGRGIGALLIEEAKAMAAKRGIDLIRVDCWAGDNGALVRVYEGYGFRRVHEFLRDQWPGMLLAMRLSDQ